MSKERERLADAVDMNASRWAEMAKEDHPDLAKVYRQDARDMRVVARMIREGADAAKVGDAVYHLDTIVRDEVPDAVFKWLRENGYDVW